VPRQFSREWGLEWISEGVVSLRSVYVDVLPLTYMPVSTFQWLNVTSHVCLSPHLSG
jgi:hypothetical protein